MILTGSKNHSVAIWHADTGKLIKKLKGHNGPVTSVAFSRDNKYVFTGTSDGIYRKWELPKEVNDAIEYTTIKWHDKTVFDSIYKIQTRTSINYHPPKVY